MLGDAMKEPTVDLAVHCAEGSTLKGVRATAIMRKGRVGVLWRSAVSYRLSSVFS